MIFDVLKNSTQYDCLNKKFGKSFDFIKKAISENLPVGRYEIEGTDLFALVQEYTTKPEQDCRFEAHRDYIDIQYVVSGVESMCVFDISKAKTTVPYDSDKDVEFFENTDIFVKATLESDEYGIFFPNDVHKPGVAYNGTPSEVRKIVVKVKL